MKKFFHWTKDNQAATAIEYGLMTVVVSIALMLLIFSFGDNLNSIFQKVSDYLASAI